MTPTLFGRWQTRFFLLSTVGLSISLLVGLITRSFLPLQALLYVLVAGSVLDILYRCIQSFRWDLDWPTSFQVMAGVLEGLLVWVLLTVVSSQMIAFPVFLGQYGSIWLISFVLTQGPLRILWPKWRYDGGQWFTRRSRSKPSTSPSVPVQAQAPRPRGPSLSSNDRPLTSAEEI